MIKLEGVATKPHLLTYYYLNLLLSKLIIIANYKFCMHHSKSLDIRGFRVLSL